MSWFYLLNDTAWRSGDIAVTSQIQQLRGRSHGLTQKTIYNSPRPLLWHTSNQRAQPLSLCCCWWGYRLTWKWHNHRSWISFSVSWVKRARRTTSDTFSLSSQVIYLFSSSSVAKKKKQILCHETSSVFFYPFLSKLFESPRKPEHIWWSLVLVIANLSHLYNSSLLQLTEFSEHNKAVYA